MGAVGPGQRDGGGRGRVDAVSFLVSALLLLGLRQTARRQTTGTEAILRQPLSTPLRGIGSPMLDVLRDPTQRAVQEAMTAFSAHGAGVVLAIIFFAQTRLELPEAQIGLVLGAAGIGGLVVSVAAARYPAPFATVRGISTTPWLSAAFVALLGMAGSFWWALLANAFVDGAVTGGFITTAAVRQQRTPIDILAGSPLLPFCNSIARIVGVEGTGLVLKMLGGQAAPFTTPCCWPPRPSLSPSAPVRHGNHRRRGLTRRPLRRARDARAAHR